MNIELAQLMTDFGGSQLTTAKDEGLLSVAICRQKALDVIDGNIKNYQANAWNKSNQMQALISKPTKNRSGNIFTLRIGGKKLFRCSCQADTTEQKVAFLTRMHDLVKNNKMDEQIENFCEKEVNLAEARKQKQREKARAKRREAAAKVKQAAEILKQAQSVVQRSGAMAIHSGSAVA